MVTHGVSEMDIIHSDNGLPPSRSQTITWTNLELIFIKPLLWNHATHFGARCIPFSAVVIYTTTSVVSKCFVHDLQLHYQQACLSKNTLFIGIDMPNRQKCVTTGPIETSKNWQCKSCIIIANTISQACHTVSNIYLQSRMFGIDTGSCANAKQFLPTTLPNQLASFPYAFRSISMVFIPCLRWHQWFTQTMQISRENSPVTPTTEHCYLVSPAAQNVSCLFKFIMQPEQRSKYFQIDIKHDYLVLCQTY